MEIDEFDERFRILYTGMVEDAYDYVNRNKDEVDDVYIFGAIGDGDYSFNAFYKINGHLVKKHKVNVVSSAQYDISDRRQFKLLDLGTENLVQIAALFKEDKRQVPSILKMVYSPKSGKFINDIIYDISFWNEGDRLPSKHLDEWFEEIEGNK